MFTAARYIAIDDDRAELGALIDALHAIGAPCIGIQFDPPKLPDESLFSGLRILLTDLHLLNAAASPNQHYDNIAAILNKCIPDKHGPFLVVLWTSHEHERAAFSARLNEILPAEKKPLAVLALDKNKFQEAEGWNGSALQNAIRAKIAEMPQLSALLSWERDVLAASNATLSLIGDLVPANDRTAGKYPGALDRVLSLLAEAAAGQTSAKANPRSAVSAALAPLLADRILNQSDDKVASELWAHAVTFPADAKDLTDIQKARMHRMLHFALPPAERVASTDWGAVTPLGEAQLADDEMLKRFGITGTQLRQTEFKVKADRINDGHLVLVRVGAECDQAQGKAGPIPTLLGLLIAKDALGKDSRSAAVLRCPEEILLEGADVPLALLVHARFATSMVAADFQHWPKPLFRIREQLLMTILVHSATHLMRPGTLRF